MPDTNHLDIGASSPAKDKSAIRARALAARQARPNDPADAFRFAEQFHEGLQHELSLTPGTVVAGYWPIRGEADPGILIEYLRGADCRIAIPRHDPKTGEMVFLEWEADTPLIEGENGIHVPPLQAKELDPDILLVPLLAFDAKGNRIGYGGGFYDRVFSAWAREGREVIKIGIAFQGQQEAYIPTEEHDQALDWILTEQGVHEVLQ